MLQIIGGPPAANPSANTLYTPTTGERYVNPSAKFSHNPMRRSKWLSYPSSASCSASDRILRTSCDDLAGGEPICCAGSQPGIGSRWSGSDYFGRGDAPEGDRVDGRVHARAECGAGLG